MNEQRPPTVLQDILPFEPLPKKSNHVQVHLRIRGLATPHLAIVIVIVIIIVYHVLIMDRSKTNLPIVHSHVLWPRSFLPLMNFFDANVVYVVIIHFFIDLYKQD